mmetsp:Transcript_17623/g.49882  ORF Transcript_17623/g.49882 Transcript_17623/m.49882 type:complete len:340 (+) Transcript_17623:195-1214(+)|eukprot:CAMPEP_0119570284 /NCGR_PEP_ID=MMETSP1352-20130426/43538_1 /TAXON_ID=265584 /ORGANISM="Stauroneis constricta, Strain CCMP1120" /LENGTH=339 /DNA_ID=CAMNT_0007619951 /DNA_START=137 /DNA_END=1156 /DNA_ORIENTATION=+
MTMISNNNGNSSHHIASANHRVYIDHYVATSNAAASAIDQCRYRDAVHGFSACLGSSRDLLERLARAPSCDNKKNGNIINDNNNNNGQLSPIQQALCEIKLDQCMLMAGCQQRRSDAASRNHHQHQGSPPFACASPNPSSQTTASTQHKWNGSDEPTAPSQSSAPSFVYSSPIRLPYCLPQSKRTGSLISVISIYNLALSYQLCAMQQQQEQQQQLPFSNCDSSSKIVDANEDAARSIRSMLEKATKLYELAYTFMEGEGLARGATFFSMAVINNLGMTHQALGRTEKAVKCFQHLLTTVMAVMHQRNGSQMLDKADLEGFLDNTCCWSRPVGQCSPAA